GDPALLLFGSVVDLLEALLVFGEGVGDRRGQGGLAVVDVTDGADVYVRLIALELLLGHALLGPFSSFSLGTCFLRLVELLKLGGSGLSPILGEPLKYSPLALAVYL